MQGRSLASWGRYRESIFTLSSTPAGLNPTRWLVLADTGWCHLRSAYHRGFCRRRKFKMQYVRRPTYQKPVFRYQSLQWKSCLTTEVRFLSGVGFFFRCRVQTVTTAQAASHPIRTGNPSRRLSGRTVRMDIRLCLVLRLRYVALYLRSFIHLYSVS
jgi:hypothetical protein